MFYKVVIPEGFYRGSPPYPSYPKVLKSAWDFGGTCFFFFVSYTMGMLSCIGGVMNMKSFVIALGVLLISGTCLYAQNKGKNIAKGVEAAVSKRVPGNAGRSAGTARGISRTTPGVASGVTGRAVTGTSAGAMVGRPATRLLQENPSALRPNVNVSRPALPKAPDLPDAPAVSTLHPQDIPQFEDIGSFGEYVIGLRDAVEKFAIAHNRRGVRDERDISKTFEEADYQFKKAIENGNYSKPYQEVWLDASKNIGRTKVNLKPYTAPDSPLQPLFKLREQQLQHALNPGTVARPVEQRFVLLDETSVRTAEEIKSLAKNLNIHDPLRADIQEELGVLEEQAGEGTSSHTFLDISRQLPNLGEEIFEFGTAHGRVGDNMDFFTRQTFEWADEKVFVKQGNKVYANPNIPKGTSYVEMWKKSVDGRSVRTYMLPESPLQQAFELRQQQLDYLLGNRDNFLVDPSVGNTTTRRTAQEIKNLLSNLPETNPLRVHLEKNVRWEKFENIGQ